MNQSNLGKFEKSVSLVCWAYNEEESIADFLERAHRLLAETVIDFEIILIDDCSTDRTPEIVRTLQGKYPAIKCFRNEKNLNVGLSSRRAFKCATKEYLFWQTIDWAYDITQLRLFLEKLKKHDVVAGVRRAPVLVADRYLKNVMGILSLFNIKHLTRRSDTPSKALVSVTNYLLIRLLFNIKLSDFQNVCIYPTKLIQSLDYESSSAFSNPEGLIKAYWSGASIVEVPISFIPRKLGVAKGTSFKSIKAAVKDVFQLWFRWNVLGKVGAKKKVQGKITRLNPAEWPDADLNRS